MQKLKNAVEKIGFNLEMLYRAADKESNNRVVTEELKIFIQALKLKISKAQLARFLFLVDEDCNGYVTKNDFYITLAAYKVNSELDLD
jgi:Ca2+-binding EF-hand superfamily protein